MSNALTARGYARHWGVSHVAVIKALRTGRITADEQGRIDPQRAVTQSGS